MAVNGDDYEEKQAINCTNHKSERVVFQGLKRNTHTLCLLLGYPSLLKPTAV